MAKTFRELETKMSPESRARSDAKTKKMIAEMALDELREARELTQQHLANLLGINQAAVSKMERRADMYIGTLQSMIRAMGGQLKIEAVFSEGNVEINLVPQAQENWRRGLRARWRRRPRRPHLYKKRKGGPAPMLKLIHSEHLEYRELTKAA